MGRGGATAALLVPLALAAGCAGHAGTDGGSAAPDAESAPYSHVTEETYGNHSAALADAGSHTLVLTADIPIEDIGTTAHMTRTYAVDRDASRYLEDTVTTAGGRELATSAVYVPDIAPDGESTGYERVTAPGHTGVEEKSVDVSSRLESHPVRPLVTALDYGPPEATTVNGSPAYRYDAEDPGLTVNVTGRGVVRDAALYLRPDGTIRRLAFTVRTDGRTLDVAYEYRDVGSTGVETPDWVPE